MKFEEIFPMVKKGRKARLPYYQENEYVYCSYRQGGSVCAGTLGEPFLAFIKNKKGFGYHDTCVSHDEIMSDDWMLISERQPMPEIKKKYPKILLFKFHRGSLEESLATIISVKSKQELENKINEKWSGVFGEYIKIISIRYFAYDERIGWDLYKVMGRQKHSCGVFFGEEFVLGDLNGDFN